MKTGYCLGFAFQGGDPNVLLIRKNKPDFQKGRLNGLGGKLEFNETSQQAMVREFVEECGVVTEEYDWIRFAIMHFPECMVDCFATVLTYQEFSAAVSLTDETIFRIPVRELFIMSAPKMLNLCWLIPMAFSRLVNREELVNHIYQGKCY